MNVLVTGGAGFIGSNLALALQDEHEVTVIDNFSSGARRNLEGFEGILLRADMASLDFNCLDADVVLHHAAITDTTLNDREKVMSVNCTAFGKLLAWCVEKNIDLVYASSASVYGNGPAPMKEGQKPDPQNVYAQSKLLMEEMARKAEGIKVIGFRYFNVYGPREQYKGAAASMIFQLYSQLLAGKKPRLFKYGEQQRDFVYVNDVVRANILAMKSKVGGVFNIGSGAAASFNEIVHILEEALGVEREIDYFDNPYGFYQNNTLADLAHTKSVLDYEPSFSSRNGIAKYVEWLEEQRSVSEVVL
ncbi:MAG: ADP-glyceromanno-heptose 6-epimerase [Candidatus Aenigmarchaeota archaeon]|nr:ADP-glyceromanno-heptose 6-epimerase [Candidatus Aenigmarchaeota archaeon]